MICAVTGASGYLGSRVAAHLEGAGHKVVRLSRSGNPPFVLGQDLAPDLFRGLSVDALVHCAYDFTLAEWPLIHATNSIGSINLLRAAHQAGVRRIVFISTMSAYSGCKSHYGKAKLAVEEEALKLGAAVIRPGLIYGEKPGGMVGKLLQLVRLSPILPLIGNGSQILYAVHEEDLLALTQHLLNHPADGGGIPVVAAHPEPWTLRKILSAFARPIRPKLYFIPLPWRWIWAIFRVLEKLRLPIAFRSDSVVSLVHQNLHPDFKSHQKLPVQFRSLRQALEKDSTL